MITSKSKHYKGTVIEIDVMVGLKALPSGSVDIIICDPPYNIGKDFGICKDKMAMDEYIAWCNDWIAEGMRVLKPTGTFYIYGFSEILAFLFVHSKADFKRWLVWHYTNKNSVKSTFWQRSHESILVLSHQDPHFNVDAAREPYSEAYKGQVGRTRKGTPGRFGNTESLYGGHPGGAQGRDVIKHPALAGGAGAKERVAWCETCSKLLVGSKEKAAHKGHKLTEHETQKPIGLTRRLIAAAKNPVGATNAVVLFSGTGAESVALAQEGCNFVAFDINDTYVKMGNAWIERVASKPQPLVAIPLGGTATSVTPDEHIDGVGTGERLSKRRGGGSRKRSGDGGSDVKFLRDASVPWATERRHHQASWKDRWAA